MQFPSIFLNLMKDYGKEGVLRVLAKEQADIIEKISKSEYMMKVSIVNSTERVL